MQKKQICFADTNHNNILISSYEKEIISTKIFNRLHHISQNSTLYLTFPSNRTKRFEHSLGTMEVCGKMFYNCIRNSDENTVDIFIEKLNKIITEDIVGNKFFEDKSYKHILKINPDDDRGFIPKNFSQLGKFNLNNIFYNGCIPSNIKNEHEKLYLIAYQAIRLCALLHDIGHPPFSHITEAAIENVYKTVHGKENKTERENRFIAILNKYYTSVTDEHASQLHEEIGNKIIEKVLEYILHKDSTASNLTQEELTFKACVFELVKLIFAEKGMLKVLHQIVDGTIDGDRIDYINRDLQNSGINGGRVAYERLISSMKFTIEESKQHVEIIYDSKNLSTIENFLQNRWYLYKNIIYHHRVSKTNALLQDCIEKISLDYLSQATKDRASSSCGFLLDNDISGLWKAIQLVSSNTIFFDALIQWDDNWLITVLKYHYFLDYYDSRDTKDEGCKKNTYYKLEEFLSNKKNYHSVIKHYSDFSPVVTGFEETINNSGIKDILEEPKIYDELEKRFNRLHGNEIVTLSAYIEMLKEKSPYGMNFYINEWVCACIENMKNDYNISDFMVTCQKYKTGLGKGAPILYRNEKTYRLDDLSSIESILDIDRCTMPSFYIYLCHDKSKISDEKTTQEFLKKVGISLAYKFIETIKRGANDVAD